MPEAKLNAVKSAETQVNGEIRCRVNITTPEGYDWETDYVVVPVTDTARLMGLQKIITEWVLANPDKVKPVTLMDGPVEREDPICLNPPPEPEPLPPPSEIVEPMPPPTPPLTTPPNLPEPDLEAVAAKMPEPQLTLEPDPEE